MRQKSYKSLAVFYRCQHHTKWPRFAATLYTEKRIKPPNILPSFKQNDLARQESPTHYDDYDKDDKRYDG